MPRIEADCGCVISASDSDESEVEDNFNESNEYLLKKRKGITVNELIKFLQGMKEKNEKVGEYVLHHSECRKLTQTLMVAVDSEYEIVVAMSYEQ